MIGKGVCDKDKGFIWNPSNYEWGFDKSCDAGEYLDYENCKCKKRLVDKLVEERSENVEEVKLAKIPLAEHKNVCKSSSILHIVLFSIIFTINIEIGTYFVYYTYRIAMKKLVQIMIISIKQQYNNINEKY